MAHDRDIPAEKVLFDAANDMRGSVESAEYKHLVLGLVFLKYVSDGFEARRREVEALTRQESSDWYADDEETREEILEDRDAYEVVNVFWVPREARWDALLALGSQPDLGVQLDAALALIERENKALKDVLPKVYARAAISPETLGTLVSTIAKIGFGTDPEKARDILGRVYEYFIKEFARSEGHRGGEFYTPGNVVRLLVDLLQPDHGRIFDPASGSCGMFIQSAKFLQSHAGSGDELAIYGQELNQATWRIGRMNLAIHGLSGHVALTQGGSLLNDAHPTLKADFVIANPPFNQKKWGAAQVADDARWKWGLPPDGNANYAWIQHFASHLAPDGRAGFVLANGSLTSSQSGEGKIREALIRDDLVDCIVALPAGLFYTTGIPVCLWFLDRNKASSDERDRRGETLFIDARTMGSKISRTQIELTEDEIMRIVDTYTAWRGQDGAHEYTDVPGFCASAKASVIQAQGFTLSPGRYVGAPEEEEDEVAFEERMAELVETLEAEMAENERLAGEVRAALGLVGYVA
ncbi:MAG: type restriction enzyme protein [Solirubrobacterales bacterium]|nr:type restriction enzyme protein [Solirubrobacterales bacterium]